MVTKQTRNIKVAIIGAGIAGIATSIRLAARGFQVEIYEANAYPGGKLTEITINGFRFDAGPSLFTLPVLVEELFDLCGEKTTEHFDYIKLENNCNYFYEDGTVIHASHDLEAFVNEVFNKTNEKPESLRKTLSRSKTLYHYLGELFMSHSLHDPATFWNSLARKAYANLHKMDFFRTMNGANQATLSDPRVIQLFNRYATYNGSDPYQTPATMNIIPHLEFGIGAFFPKNGMHDITLSLTELAKRQGVKFHFNQPVNEIVLEKQHVKGIKIGKEIIPFDRVVSNMDIVGTYQKLLPAIKPTKRLLSQPKSSSALIFYWGINRSFPELDLHNIFFSADYREEFKSIFTDRTIFSDPTVYVNITSKYKSNDAPDQCENWFVMINVPNNQGQDWDQLIAISRKNILEKMSRILKTEVEKVIVAEDYLDPRLIEKRTSSSFGALYGNSSNNRFAAFLRHANFSKRIGGLYFCGGSVHPGGGIPMCLSSAKIVDRYFN